MVSFHSVLPTVAETFQNLRQESFQKLRKVPENRLCVCMCVYVFVSVYVCVCIRDRQTCLCVCMEKQGGIY